MPEKRAAIDIDTLGDKTVEEISAAELVEVLDAGGSAALGHIGVLPEKKKAELETDQPRVKDLRVRDLINIVVVEKKKKELEKPPWAEAIIDRGDIRVFPEFKEVLDRLDKLERQIGN